MKINYPSKKKPSTTITFKKYSNRGMLLEADLNDTNFYYLNNDIAIIYKKPTPIGIVKTNGVRITDAYFKQPSTTDYNGIYKGKYIDFEAKETNSLTSFPISNIHNHQIKHIESVLKHDGIAFIIVRFSRTNDTYLLFGKDLISFIKNNKRNSIPLEYFKEKGYLINYKLKIKVDYIEILNKYGGIK